MNVSVVQVVNACGACMQGCVSVSAAASAASLPGVVALIENVEVRSPISPSTLECTSSLVL